MNSDAIVAAATSLERAKLAMARLNDLGPPPYLARLKFASAAWSDVLTAGNRVFAKLEQGAKTGPDAGWFGQIKSERRSDPLLRYMQHARNADEHGLRSIDRIVPGHTKISIPSGTPLNAELGLDDKGEIYIVNPGSGAILTSQTRAELILEAVYDRGQRYEVPAEHLGQILPAQDPGALAAAFVAYLSNLVATAQARSAG